MGCPGAHRRSGKARTATGKRSRGSTAPNMMLTERRESQGTQLPPCTNQQPEKLLNLNAKEEREKEESCKSRHGGCFGNAQPRRWVLLQRSRGSACESLTSPNRPPSPP